MDNNLNSINTKLDGVVEDIADVRHKFGVLQDEVAALRGPSKVQDLMHEGEIKIKSIQTKFEMKMNKNKIDGQFIRLDCQDKPGSTIVQCGEDQDVTYIVTGTRGLGKLRRTIMGSVSDYVIHHAHVPVLVVRCK